MKKKFLVFSLLIVLIVVSAFSGVTFATTHTLDELADTFNNCETVKRYKEYNCLISAKVKDNTLTIEAEYNGTKNTYEYILNGSILSGTIANDGTIYDLTTVIALMDCVGQLHGYKDGEMFNTLNSDEIREYTVAEEGIEIKNVTDDSIEVKIDIDKKIPLIDLSKMYLKPADFEDVRGLIERGVGGGFSGYKIKMVYSIFAYDSKNVEMIIGEKDEITESTYKSILSAIEVIFDDTKAVEYFEKNYKSMSDGNKEFAGFKVEVDTDDELSAPEETKKSKVTVDIEAAREAMEDEVYTRELSRAIADAEEIFDNKDVKYTEDSLAILRDALIDGKIFFDPERREGDSEDKTVAELQEEVNTLTKAINDAIEALEKEYTLEGADQIFKLENGKHLTFKFDIDFEDFKTYGDIWLDEKRIEEDNYTAESGSTIITFKDEFTKTLAEGPHHLEVALAQGRLGIAKTDFTIEKADITSTVEKTTGTTPKSNISNPRTGDNILVYVGIAVMAIASLSVTYYSIKKNDK